MTGALVVKGLKLTFRNKISFNIWSTLWPLLYAGVRDRLLLILSEFKRIVFYSLSSTGMEVNLIRLILEAKFGDDPLLTMQTLYSYNRFSRILEIITLPQKEI